MRKKEQELLIKLCIAAACLALCMVLPFLTGQIQQIGSMLCPMHIPVLICAFLCGWPYALCIGVIAPPLRFLLFGMPPILPIGLGMLFELAAYGLIAGLSYKMLPKKLYFLYLSLLIAMLGGRAVWGVARFLIGSVTGSPFTLPMFFAGGFTNAIPGIILQLILIPPVVIALRKASVIPKVD